MIIKLLILMIFFSLILYIYFYQKKVKKHIDQNDEMHKLLLEMHKLLLEIHNSVLTTGLRNLD
jgi:hypothetical protein